MIELKNKFLKMLIIVLCCAYSISALSSYNINDTLRFAKLFGCNIKIDGDTIDVYLNEAVILGIIPNLQKIGMLNKKMSALELMQRPYTTTGTVGLWFIALFIQNYYKENPSIESLKFKVYFQGSDDNFNDITKLIYSFDFNRGIYSQINWKHFMPIRLLVVSKNFQFSDWYSNQNEDS